MAAIASTITDFFNAKSSEDFTSQIQDKLNEISNNNDIPGLSDALDVINQGITNVQEFAKDRKSERQEPQSVQPEMEPENGTVGQ